MSSGFISFLVSIVVLCSGLIILNNHNKFVDKVRYGGDWQVVPDGGTITVSEYESYKTGESWSLDIFEGFTIHDHKFVKKYKPVVLYQYSCGGNNYVATLNTDKGPFSTKAGVITYMENRYPVGKKFNIIVNSKTCDVLTSQPTNWDDNIPFHLAIAITVFSVIACPFRIRKYHLIIPALLVSKWMLKN